jgi:glycosyltransferase involved in cell wall biosynthesis
MFAALRTLRPALAAGAHDHAPRLTAGRAGVAFDALGRNASKHAQNDHQWPGLSGFGARPRVVCVQRRLTHYRVPMFEALRNWLDDRQIDFVLAHGQPTAQEESKHDAGALPWAVQVPCHYAWGGRLAWQSLTPVLQGADLVIVPHENRLLYNLLAMSLHRPPRLAFWGHGRNFQSPHPEGMLERFKRFSARRADWWFAYTSLSAGLLQQAGVPADRISTVNNTVDTARLAAECAAVTEAEIGELRLRWRLGDGPVALSMGSLYAEKRVPFLLEAGAELARRVPGFRLLVVGDGPDQALVRAALPAQPWLRSVGTRFGREKATFLRAAKLMLNPGLVGLGILDAFAAGLPLVTTDCGLHSPEIAYLRHGENGCMTPDTVGDFVAGCERLLRDEPLRLRMGAAAARDATRHNLDDMVRRFGEGVIGALKLPAR